MRRSKWDWMPQLFFWWIEQAQFYLHAKEAETCKPGGVVTSERADVDVALHNIICVILNSTTKIMIFFDSSFNNWRFSILKSSYRAIFSPKEDGKHKKMNFAWHIFDFNYEFMRLYKNKFISLHWNLFDKCRI